MSNRVYYTQEAEMQANRERLVLAMIAMGFGVGLGSLLMLLFAPQAGVKTRNELGEQLGQSGEQVQRYIQQAGNNIREQVSKAQDEVEERVQSLNKR
jgi:gas vesicle protein